ncbi:hypothetical protein M1B72_20845 [Geomonas paludis]|uniref:Uncharacterized protein n=1 Tax=Geomonas paludis TaxID=2740185 RepID=A0A6V8MR36_9BACT|nr:hypothetical protein [Geomonas paludis]UPU35858.1 hypothetical protein M1B72_20845 [Geomonas paludis]GFO62558.1 hypothetical protein GMPD_04770 [Geomonas paludis]
MSEKSRTLKSIGSKVRDRVRQWLDELFPVIFPPVPCPVPVRGDRSRR